MEKLFDPVLLLLSDFHVIFVVECIAIAIKTYLLFQIIKLIFYKKPQRSLWLLILILSGGIFEDAAWLVKITRNLFVPEISYALLVAIVRIAWVCFTPSWHAFGLLLETLACPSKPIAWHQKIFMIITAGFVSCYLYILFTNFHTVSIADHPPFEKFIVPYTMWYAFIVMFPGIVLALYQMQRATLPKILNHQLAILLRYIVPPLIIAQLYNIIAAQPARYASNTIYEILLTIAIYYATIKMVNLRFLNLQEHVHVPQKNYTNEPIKNILEQLSVATNLQELANITKSFFYQAFKIPLARIQVFFRNTDQPARESHQSIDPRIELFISQKLNDKSRHALQRTQILIFDELAFNAYASNDEITHEFLDFMQTTNADIFVPLYQNQNTIIGYIVVARNARNNELYNDAERDLMVIFAQFMANVAVILRHHHIESLLTTTKQLKDELYHKHQEITQYKESIRSFLGDVDQREIGVLFYKNRTFFFANQAAKDLIGINPSTQEGHPLAKALNNLVKSVQAYQTAQTCYAVNEKGKRITLTALTNLQANNVIILIHYPDIAHVLRQQIDHLDNPSDWDYLLYLETTPSGQLVNQAIPGNTKTLLNLKINLLKSALTKKVLFIDAPEHDLITIVELIHHISLRTTLNVLKLEALTTHHTIIDTLFGVNNVLGSSVEQPLMEKLNQTGTLFIQNIQHLDLETQKHLAQYLTSGYYKPYKSEHAHKSDVRVICSTPCQLITLAQENKLIPELYELLKNGAHVEIPAITTLNNEDIACLAENFAQQALEHTEFKNFFELTEKEKQKLIAKKSVSLHEFKQQVQRILETKSQKSHIETTTIHAPTTLVDPELLAAARLGKHALKNQQLMALLWNKFKSQNKIATFLGVNRSSVNRRCKDYQLN